MVAQLSFASLAFVGKTLTGFPPRLRGGMLLAANRSPIEPATRHITIEPSDQGASWNGIYEMWTGMDRSTPP